MPEPKVMPPPSSSADSDDEEEPQEHSWWEQVRHMWSSPLMATACCIFLCYILKVLQQVPAPAPCAHCTCPTLSYTPLCVMPPVRAPLCVSSRCAPPCVETMQLPCGTCIYLLKSPFVFGIALPSRNLSTMASSVHYDAICPCGIMGMGVV